MAILENVERYPSVAELDDGARQQCLFGIDNTDGQLAATAAWDSPSAFRENGYIAGACFIFEKSGQALPPRP